MDTLTLLQKQFPGKAFLTLGETAHYLRLSRTAFWDARKNGNAPRTIKVGKIQRVYLRDLAEFIDKQR